MNLMKKKLHKYYTKFFRHVGGLQRSYTSQRSTISNITKSEMIEMNGASITTTTRMMSLDDQSSVSLF